MGHFTKYGFDVDVVKMTNDRSQASNDYEIRISRSRMLIYNTTDWFHSMKDAESYARDFIEHNMSMLAKRYERHRK